jgi:hypothetical protein
MPYGDPPGAGRGKGPKERLEVGDLCFQQREGVAKPTARFCFGFRTIDSAAVAEIDASA